MKIAHIIFDLGNGGAENMLIDIINEQVKLENFITLVIINKYIEKDKIERLSNKVKLIRLDRKPKSNNPFIFLKLYKHLFRNKFDVLHCHNQGIGKILMFYRKRKVVTVHGIGWNSKALKYYSKIFAISRSVQNDITTKGYNSIVIYNGVDISLIKCKKVYKKNKQFKIVQIGRLNHQLKGQDLILEALIELTKTNNIHITFIGDGESKKYLKTIVENNHLKMNVSFKGNKNRDYIYKNLLKYDLLVQPSRQEGFGLTIVEAMFAKIPVLVSDIDGPFEIIDSGNYGYFFENCKIESLIDSIKEIIKLPDIIINKRVDDAYLFAVEKFDIKKTAKLYIENYLAK